MSNKMIDTRDVILALKKVKSEQKLSIDKILKMVEQQDPSTAVSRTSIARVFRKGSEEHIFKYEGTLRPIAKALLDIENIETTDDTETTAYKSILRLKADLIEELESKIQTVESEEHAKYQKKLEQATESFQRSVAFLKEQIILKDKRIDQLMDANEKLMQELLNCPQRGMCQK